MLCAADDPSARATVAAQRTKQGQGTKMNARDISHATRSISGSIFRRPWFIASAAVCVALIVLVALAPVLLSGYVRGMIVREVGAKVQGTVSVASVQLGWFSPQRVDALAIDGGRETGVVTVTAQVAQGLLALATGDEVTVQVSGRAQTPIDAEAVSGL